eukprot:8127178-Pyramimonas_sp.AAC.1
MFHQHLCGRVGHLFRTTEHRAGGLHRDPSHLAFVGHAMQGPPEARLKAPKCPHSLSMGPLAPP